ncbi:hypothetical protein [uncultured Paracoccus sp.]|uniref:hypothetical protein n=1 Tax=uncultured Paracoccus sp. TaxID=189685 RepID=UPI0025F9C6AF|nr:hypothetical protein [uncultured Paracoccus sp.]
MRLTLDTNCLIDIADKRERAPYVEALRAAAEEGRVLISLVASSASEKQQSGDFLSSMGRFKERVAALGFGDSLLLPSIARFDVSFFEHGLHCDNQMLEREHKIYRVLFPTSPPEWADYAKEKGHMRDDRHGKGYFRWRNQLLDAQAFWAHEHASQDIFVTSDARFKVLEGHRDFPTAVVKEAREVVEMIGPAIK